MGLSLSAVRAFGTENVKEARKLLKALKSGQDVNAHFTVTKAQEEQLKKLIPNSKLFQPEEDTVLLSSLDKRLAGDTVKSDIDVSSSTHGDCKLFEIDGISGDKDGILQTHEYKILTNPDGTIITGRTEGCGMNFEIDGTITGGLSRATTMPKINYLEQDGHSLVTMEGLSSGAVDSVNAALYAPTDFLNKNVQAKSKGAFKTASECFEALKKLFTPQN